MPKQNSKAVPVRVGAQTCCALPRAAILGRSKTAPLHNQTKTKIRKNPRPAPAAQAQLADVWRVVMLNDPVSLMSYVVMVLKKVMGFEEMRARKHMLEAHEKGRSVIWTGVREQAEAYAFTLQQWHINAVIEADESA